MKKRIITGAIYLGILLPLVILNYNITKIGYLILTMFVTFYGTFEIMRAANNDNKKKGDGCDLGAMTFVIPVLSSVAWQHINLVKIVFLTLHIIYIY